MQRVKASNISVVLLSETEELGPQNQRCKSLWRSFSISSTLVEAYLLIFRFSANLNHHKVFEIPTLNLYHFFYFKTFRIVYFSS